MQPRLRLRVVQLLPLRCTARRPGPLPAPPGGAAGARRALLVILEPLLDRDHRALGPLVAVVKLPAPSRAVPRRPAPSRAVPRRPGGPAAWLVRRLVPQFWTRAPSRPGAPSV